MTDKEELKKIKNGEIKNLFVGLCLRFDQFYLSGCREKCLLVSSTYLSKIYKTKRTFIINKI